MVQQAELVFHAKLFASLICINTVRVADKVFRLIIKPSFKRLRIGVAISSSWHRTAAADYPQWCSAA
jgi:hypothetical protein